MFWEMAEGFETTDWSDPPNQSVYSSNSSDWFQEPFTFHSSTATSSAALWSNGENNTMVASTEAPYSTVGNSWSKSFAHFGHGQRVL